MRALVVTTSFPSQRHPVSGLFVERLARALSDHARVTVLVPGRWCSDVGSTTALPYQVCNFRYGAARMETLTHGHGGIPAALQRNPLLWCALPLLLLGLFGSVLRHARNHDIIHANWTLIGLITGIAGWLTRRPVITTVRGADVSRVEKSRVQRGMLALCLSLNRYLVCVSEEMQARLIELFPSRRERIQVIPNGVDQSFIDLPAPARRTPADPLRLIVVGSLIPRKSVADLMTALGTLKGVRIELDVVGDGPCRPALERQAQSLPESIQVRFHGNLGPERIPTLLAQADATILTSRSEGRPNVVMEAMAAGRLVIATRIPGVTELIDDRHSGRLFAVGDTAALAGCIEWAVSRPNEARQTGLAGRSALLEKGCSWQTAAERYVTLYSRSIEPA